MNETMARQFAREWITAWNSHDLEAILAHYADDAEFTSPFVAKLAGNQSGQLCGKTALRDYFSEGLARYPGLQFELQHVLWGVRNVTVVYRSVNNLIAAESMTLGPSQTVVRSEVAYSQDASEISPVTVTEHQREGYLLTDDPAKADLDSICRLLHSTYWADDRSREVIDRSLKHSVCLHLLHNGTTQVGLIRGVTDHATFTWVCDVVVDSAHRGRGLGKWMVEKFLAHPELQTISHHLCTKDAHSLYEPFGFQKIEAMRRSKRALPFLLKEPVGQS